MMKTNSLPDEELSGPYSLVQAKSVLETYQKKLEELNSYMSWLADYQKKMLDALEEEREKISHRLSEQAVIVQKIEEIYRLAKFQFSRLQGRNAKLAELLPFQDTALTPDDVVELEKWIGRVKTLEGYQDIIDALKELSKYKPGSVKNVYALTQKIIIEGARGK